MYIYNGVATITSPIRNGGILQGPDQESVEDVARTIRPGRHGRGVYNVLLASWERYDKIAFAMSAGGRNGWTDINAKVHLCSFRDRLFSREASPHYSSNDLFFHFHQ